MDTNLDYRANRAVEARFYRSYGRLTSWVSLLLWIGLTAAGVLLFLSGRATAWLVIGLGSSAAVPFWWVKLHLKPLPATKRAKSINDLLSSEVLGLLPVDVNPQLIVSSLLLSQGAGFFSRRFGISIEQLARLTPTDINLMTSVWQESLNIWTNMVDRSDVISSAVVLAAIIRLNPATDDMLGSLRIDKDDVYLGVVWFEHINGLFRTSLEPKLTGGIARDWSFGYIPTLENFGENISDKYSSGNRSIASSLESTRAIIGNMVDLVWGGTRRNVALIGPFGAGKSTIVEAFAETIMSSATSVPATVKFNQVFKLDASSIISAARGRGGVEQLMNQLMVEAYRAKNIILFLDNAELFFADSTGSIDLSNILQPAIEGGGLKLIMAMNEQKFLQISQAKPALTSSLNRIEVKPADRDATMQIMEDRIISLEYRSRCTFTYQSLTEAYRLASRYIDDVAQPRASIQLLENSIQQADQTGVVTPTSLSATIEKTLGIKVGGDLSGGDEQDERAKLLNLENLIHHRMINQAGAVSAVASALRRARAGVRSESRPIGTFLFLGPTGVGKTELAKSLADVYFGGEGHMVRIDLNEYVRAEDVARLIADGATDAMSLSAQVRKNPFSVVLLDEIEKAHPNVLTTLLQVLDEGVLRDINNREVSFRDAILIATSNAGANLIRQYIEAGYSVEQFSKQIQDQLINSGQFRPEFLNRFDEIAVFRPLTKEELLQVIDLIMVGINKNLAHQKVFVAVDDDAKRALVDAGYDPRLGARPMRRVVQKTVENMVAEKMLAGQLVSGSGIRLSLMDIQNSLSK